MSSNDNPLVSIIVPARNEEACLRLCLESLVSQSGGDFEIIVVDDGSTDRTAEIARSFATIGSNVSLQVITAPLLSPGWTGKNNAMSAGEKIARGKWLLFTDADTFHYPGSLASAVAEAEHHAAALLSYSPEQELRGFWQNAVMPVIFAELAATYPPKKVSDPASPIAAANGQYLLISREAYDAVGGHTSIAADLLEDVAIARLVKASGGRVLFRYGGDAVRTRMYRSWSQMREGWTKNLALLFPHPRWLALRRALEFSLIVSLPIMVAVFFLTGHRILALLVLLLCLVVVVSIEMRIRRAHFGAMESVFSILGLPLFAYFLLRSAFAHSRARVHWKGRLYGPPASPAVAKPND